MNKNQIINKVEEILHKKYDAGSIDSELVESCINSTLEVINYSQCCTELKDKEAMTFDEWVDAEGYYEKEGNWFNKHGYSRDMKKLRKWYGLRDCL